MKRFILLGALIVGLIFSLSGCSMFNQGPEIQNWQPTVSPTSDRVVFSSKVDGNFELFSLDPESGEKTQITDNDYDDWGPDWGPEGKRLAFVSQRDDNTDIYVLNVESGEETRLTENKSQDVNPRWDGKSTVIFNSDRTDAWEIFTVSLPENELSQITTTTEEGE